MQMIVGLVLVILVTLPCLVLMQEENIIVTSSCSVSNNTLVRNFTEDNSYFIRWDGDYPFTGQDFCRMNFARYGELGRTWCIKLSEIQFTTNKVYVTVYKNNQTYPMKTLRRGDDAYDEGGAVYCGGYSMVIVDIGADSATTSSSVSGSHISIYIYNEAIAGDDDDDDDGPNFWVVLSISLSVGMTVLSIAAAVACRFGRMYCYARMAKNERRNQPPQVVYQPSKI